MNIILQYLGNNINFLYTFILHLTLIIGAFSLSRSLFKNFKLIPIFKSYIGYFWLSVGLFWLSNIIQIFLSINHYDIAGYLSYFSFTMIAIQSIIIGTFCLSIIFNQFRFAPIFFFITLLYNALGTVVLFLQKNLFITNGDHWTNQFILNYDLQAYLLYALIPPLILFILIILGKTIYLLIRKQFHTLHKISLYITFTFFLYISIFAIYYGNIYPGWTNILLLISLLLAPLFAYLLLVNTTAYQQEIINPKLDTRNIVKIPLLFKFLLGELIAILIPLAITNAIIIVFYQQVIGDNLLVSTHSILIQHAIILNFFIIVFAFSFNIIMTKKIIHRLELLMKGTIEIQQENLNYQIPLDGNDEITALTMSFNQMIQSLKGYKTELKNYSLILEDEIEKQTIELRKKRHEAEVLAEQNMTLYKELQKQTSTIIDNITDSLIAIDDQGKVMNVNKIFTEKFASEDGVILGKEFKTLDFVEQYELNKIIEMFQKQNLKKYNFKLNLTKPHYGVLQCYMSVIELENNKKGILFLMQDTTPPWGTVLSSGSYEPVNLAIVRLFDNSNNKLVETAVTDDNGRFGFFVKPGEYYMTVDKDDFHFPSKSQAGYHGEIIDVKSKEEGIIKLNILVDPTSNTRTGINQENTTISNPIEEITKDMETATDINSNTNSLTSLALETNNTSVKKDETTITKTEEANISIEEKTQAIADKPTAISSRAQAAKEAAKAAKGNTNPEEKPGAMLKKIEHMIKEEKIIKGDKKADDTTTA